MSAELGICQTFWMILLSVTIFKTLSVRSTSTSQEGSSSIFIALIYNFENDLALCSSSFMCDVCKTWLAVGGITHSEKMLCMQQGSSILLNENVSEERYILRICWERWNFRKMIVCPSKMLFFANSLEKFVCLFLKKRSWLQCFHFLKKNDL